MERLSNKQAITLIIAVCLNIAILMTNKIIIQEYQSASILNTIYVGVISIIITLVVCLLYKKFVGVGILKISEYLGGKFLKTTVGIIFIIYFLITMSVLLCKIVDSLKVIYYPMTNNIYIILLFLVSTGIICNLKNNAFARTSLIILPLSLIILIFAFVGNFPNFDFQNIYPLFGESMEKTFFSGISSVYTFGGIAYIFFLPPLLENKEKFCKISVIGMFISVVFVVITVATISLMFIPKMVQGELFPLYTSVRYIEFGTFFQRLDSAFLLIRIMAFQCYMGIVAYLILNIMKEIFEIKDKTPLIYPLMLIIFSITMIFDVYYKVDMDQNNLIKILFFVVNFGVGILILICANLKKVIVNRRENL